MLARQKTWTWESKEPARLAYRGCPKRWASVSTSSHFGSRLKFATWIRQTPCAFRSPFSIGTRSWQTVEVDLGPVSVGQVDLIAPRVQGLVELGIPVASPVRCLGLADQVAQKLHACTGPAATGRARDVLDILLIDAFGQVDYAEIASTAQRVFEGRATHAYPPQFVMPAEWSPELEALAAELDFPLKTSAAIERRFLAVIQRLSEQRSPP